MKKAQEAKGVHEQAKLNEEAGLGTLEELVDQYMPKTVTWISDGKSGTIPLPNGFYYVGGDIDTGIVISDKQGDEIDASGVDMGNQFVWIPVENEEALTRTKFNSSGQPITRDNLNGESGENYTYEDYMNEFAIYTEPFDYTYNSTNFTGYPTEANEYTTMRSQVLKYGGFYIGRYEAGINSTTKRTGVTTAQTVVSKKGVAPYNYVPWGAAMNDASEISGKSGAVYLAKSMYSTSESVTSTLIYGCQWDAMCRYIGDANRKDLTLPNSPQLTGSDTDDVSKNIYDLAGNCSEWTMEAYSTHIRVIRGGYCSGSGPVSSRGISIPTSIYGNNYRDISSFRCGLYIK